MQSSQFEIKLPNFIEIKLLVLKLSYYYSDSIFNFNNRVIAADEQQRRDIRPVARGGAKGA